MFQESCALYILPQSKLVIMFSTTMINSNTLSHSVTLSQIRSAISKFIYDVNYTKQHISYAVCEHACLMCEDECTPHMKCGCWHNE